MKILYVTHTQARSRPYLDSSVRYRCYNFAEELSDRGHKAAVCSLPEFENNFSRLDGYDIYVFHRPVFNNRLARLILRLRANRLVIADYDDYSFHPAALAHLPGMMIGREGMLQQSQGLALMAACGELFDYFTVSTTPLQEAVEKFFSPKKSMALHNAVSRTMTGTYRIARKLHPWAKRPYRVGYQSGSKSHSRDFQMIAQTLANRVGNGRILLAGPCGDGAKILKDTQVTTQDLCIFPLLPMRTAQCQTVLAPLEWTPFAIAKSAIKFYEGALAGCFVLATPIPDMERFDSPLLIKCKTAENWDAALANLPTSQHDMAGEIARLEEEVSVRRQVDRFIEDFVHRL